MLTRRGILTSLVGLVAAPAIIKVAGVMPVKPRLVPTGHGLRIGAHVLRRDPVLSGPGPGNEYLTIEMVTREAVRLFTESNRFLEHINMQYDREFARGDVMRDLLAQPVPPVAAAALGAAAVLHNNPTLSRRGLFFGGVREEGSDAAPGSSSSDPSRRITHQETVA